VYVPNDGGPPSRGSGAYRLSGDSVQSACSGGTTTCKHSQELTPELLELKVTSVFIASIPFTAFFSRLRATPVVGVF